MKIWLDDIRQAPKGWTWFKTGEEVIEVLKNERVEEISFDHDLGEGMSGYDVAKWIEEMAAKEVIDPICWRVHSANPVGKKNIEAAMNKADELWIYQEDEDEEDDEIRQPREEDWK